MRLRILPLLLAAALIALPGADALAKSSSFSSGGGRSSSSGSSGWSSSSRPSSPSPSSSGGSSGWSSGSSASKPSSGATPPLSSQPAQQSGTQSGQSGWSNSSGASAQGAAKPGTASSFSSSGNASVNRMASTRSYQEYQGQFAKGGNAVPNAGGQPILNPGRTFNTYNEYNTYRTNYYGSRGWFAPGYAYGGYSSFGMWDAMFLWFMLSHAGGGSFFYNHQNDPGVQAFQRETQTLAASNEDLKKQVSELNTKVEELKKSGAPVDPKALPPDVDPAVAMAKPPVAEAESPQGSGGGWFFPMLMGASALVLGLMLFNRIRRRSA